MYDICQWIELFKLTYISYVIVKGISGKRGESVIPFTLTAQYLILLTARQRQLLGITIIITLIN